MPRILAPQLALQIIDYLRAQRLPADTPLRTQVLADHFKVSRAPVMAALKQLAAQGVVYAEYNRGYFLACDALQIAPPPSTESTEEVLYYRLAEDHLAGQMPERISESELMRRYAVQRSVLRNVLQRAADDLWLERLPGHGWRFLPVLNSQQGYEEGYRFRAAVEPLALLEPGFRVDPVALKALRAQQQSLLEGGFERMSRSHVFDLNAEFHEVLVGFSHNPFFVDALKKVNRVRRLLDYRSTLDRSRLPQQCQEHLQILDLLELGQTREAATLLSQHLWGAMASKRDLVALLR